MHKQTSFLLQTGLIFWLSFLISPEACTAMTAPTPESFNQQLTAADPAARLAAAEYLAQHPEVAQPCLPALLTAVADDDELVLEAVTAALETVGPPTAAQEAQIAKLLVAESADVGFWSATLLGRLGSAQSPQSIEVLAHSLESSPHANVRQRAAWALKEAGPTGKPAQAALARVVASADSDPRLKRLAQQALAGLTQDES